MATVLCLLAGMVAAQLASAWPAYPVDSAPPALRPAVQRGNLVIVSLQSAILGELRDSLAEGGPEHALRSCHLDATGVAWRIQRREGVRAGRTSARLRNPANAPPPWAADVVARHRGSKFGDLDGFVVDLSDRIGLLQPIVEQPMCAACHGPVDRIAAPVKAALATRYPADRATGFKDGDLRGWFWVELPKESRRTP